MALVDFLLQRLLRGGGPAADQPGQHQLRDALHGRLRHLHLRHPADRAHRGQRAGDPRGPQVAGFFVHHISIIVLNLSIFAIYIFIIHIILSILTFSSD